jgi:hypothetical protein
MHSKIPLKLTVVILLLALVSLLTLLPVAAQEPDVEAQIVDFVEFIWNPDTTVVARGDGSVRTELVMVGAQQVSGFSLVIGYNASVIKPDSIDPGDLLPGTPGVDYFFTVQTGGNGVNCEDGLDSSFTIHVAYFDPTVTIEGTGPVADITWRSDPDAAVGDVGYICLSGGDSLVVDNGGVPSLTPVVDTLGTIIIEPANLFKIQLGLEGGKNSGDVILAAPEEIYTIVTINGIYPCDSGGVDALGFCAFNNATTSPPYAISVNRFGYLSAQATFAGGTDATSIWLLAGDLNDDDVVNILDIQLLASLMGAPVVATSPTLLHAADYTGPGFLPDNVVNIQDLVLVARNFGVSGPTDGTLPDGSDSFPF